MIRKEGGEGCKKRRKRWIEKGKKKETGSGS